MVKYNNENKITDIRIIDFGFGIFIEEMNENTPRCGTPNFIAPEIISG